MPSVCFYFQVHQPFRVKRYSYFQIKSDHIYFDDDKNGTVLKKVANKCYLPTNATMLELIKRYAGEFRISYSITGTAIEQMKLYCPEALTSFEKLAGTGAVEFINETYYHSLAAVYEPEEFKEQVAKHTALMKSHFGQTPKVFRDTELIYSDEIGKLVSELGFDAIIAEGVDDVLDWRSPNFLYAVPRHLTGGREVKLLLKNYRLSDDIAFRFSNRGWPEWPLTAEKFAKWVHEISGNGDVLNLFMDYETFGEHQWADTGIFEFMRHLPEQILRKPDWNFRTPSQISTLYPSRADLPFHRLTSWADIERDLTAWRGNRIQNSALELAYQIGRELKRRAPLPGEGPSFKSELLDTWRKLLTSDHFYYMCTKWFADGDVHAYFSPYESPYEAFINYMNVLRDFRERWLPGWKPPAHAG
jgi:alpha-amylase